MLRVLHVIPSVSRSEGGPSYAVFAFARAANSAGAETVIVTTGSDESDQSDGIKCLRFSRDLEPYKVSFSLQRWLGLHVREFDLVHIHALFSFSSWAAARAARKQRVPYIVRPLGVLNRWGLAHRRRLLKRFWLRFIEVPVLRNAAAIHYTSEAERTEAAAVGSEIAGLASFIIPIPVSGSRGANFTAGGREPLANRPREAGDSVLVKTEGQTAGSSEHGASFLATFPEARGKKIVLFLARLDEKKGLDVLLRAFVDVKREHGDTILVIAGSGQEKFVDQLHSQAQALGIANDIIWTGFLPGDQKTGAFSAATVYVLPSYSENFGIAAAEALAAGIPTVLSDQVAIASDAADANAAIVVGPDPMAIAGAIKQLLGNRLECEDLGRNAKLFALRAFSSERVSEQLVAEYRKILNPAS